MLVAQLALKRGGRAIDDPKSWWDSLPEGTVDFWQAVYQVAPFGEEWKQTAQLSQLLWQVFSSQVEFNGQRPNLTVDDFMPIGYVPIDDTPAILRSNGGITDPIAQQQELCKYLGLEWAE